MKVDDMMVVTVAREAASHDLREQIQALAIDEGWGVFEHHSGIAALPFTKLVAVWEDEENAKGDAEKRNEHDGIHELEVASDPDSHTYRSVSYDTGRVVLKEIVPKVGFTATYERVTE